MAKPAMSKPRTTPWNGIGIFLILVAAAVVAFGAGSNPVMGILFLACVIGAIASFATSRKQRHS